MNKNPAVVAGNLSGNCVAKALPNWHSSSNEPKG